MTHKQRPLLVRILFGGFGIGCVGIGFIGILTPGLPGFVFFVIALWAFRNSSQQMEDWILANKFIGPTLKDWEENRSMKQSTKILAISMIWIAIGVTIYRILTTPPIVIKAWNFHLPKWIPIVLLVGTILGLTIYLIKVPTKQIKA